MAIAPDGRLFVCEQGGDLRVIKNGALLSTPFVSITVDDFFERGLLGVAFDPNFVTNKYVYVYYTVPGNPPHNRVSRFTANGDVAVPGSELTCSNLERSRRRQPQRRRAPLRPRREALHRGRATTPMSSNAQTLSNLHGKILRINSERLDPAGQPVRRSGRRPKREIWALGLRNPFTFGVQPGTGRIFINDVGQNTWEEINDGARGANYGWPNCEGDCDPADPDFTRPALLLLARRRRVRHRRRSLLQSAGAAVPGRLHR